VFGRERGFEEKGTHVAIDNFSRTPLLRFREYEEVVEEVDVKLAAATSLLDSAFAEDVALAKETGRGGEVEVL
jgi:hypothetical protein